MNQQLPNSNVYIDQAIELAIGYGPKLVLAIFTLIIGLWVIKLFAKGLTRAFQAKEFDASLQGFLVSLSSMILKVMLAISVAGMIGIEMTSFIAVLGAAGLAVGMALSGTLQNFAGGVMILIFRPFKVGDFIEAQGFTGTVREIQIFQTILTTGDNKRIIIPNAPLSTGSLTNFSAEETRRVDFTFGIGYEDDIDLAKNILRSIINEDSRAFKDPEPFIVVGELADNSVNLILRVWAKSSDYWGIYFDTLEAVKKEFDQQGISIPYPQQDVHIHQVDSAVSKIANA